MLQFYSKIFQENSAPVLIIMGVLIRIVLFRSLPKKLPHSNMKAYINCSDTIVDSKKNQEHLLVVPDRYKNLTESMYVFNASKCYSNY